MKSVSLLTMLQRSTKSTVVVQPKCDNQSVSDIKHELMNKVFPVKANINLYKAKPGRKGSVIVSCKNTNNSNKIKDVSKIFSNYILYC